MTHRLPVSHNSDLYSRSTLKVEHQKLPRKNKIKSSLGYLNLWKSATSLALKETKKAIGGVYKSVYSFPFTYIISKHNQ